VRRVHVHGATIAHKSMCQRRRPRFTAMRGYRCCYNIKYTTEVHFAFWSSLQNTPHLQRNTPAQSSSRKSVTFRTSLTGLSALFAKRHYHLKSSIRHRASGSIRRSGFGVSLLSPLRSVIRQRPTPGNAITGERILQRPTPRHLWATDQPRMC